MPQPKIQFRAFPYGKRKNTKSNGCDPHPPRPWYTTMYYTQSSIQGFERQRKVGDERNLLQKQQGLPHMVAPAFIYEQHNNIITISNDEPKFLYPL